MSICDRRAVLLFAAAYMMPLPAWAASCDHDDFSSEDLAGSGFDLAHRRTENAIVKGVIKGLGWGVTLGVGALFVPILAPSAGVFFAAGFALGAGSEIMRGNLENANLLGRAIQTCFE